MSTTPVKVLGFSYELPQPYAVGHCCTAAEASALNRILTRGLAKGLYKVLSSGLKPLGHDRAEGLSDAQRSGVESMGLEYIADFCLGFSAGHETTRSIRVEAERIARQMLETQLYKQGKSLKDLHEKEREAHIDQLAVSDRVRAEAERRVRVTQEIAERAHGELLESLGEDQ